MLPIPRFCLLIITDMQKMSSLEFQINELQKSSKKFMLGYVADCSDTLSRSLNFANVLVRGFLLQLCCAAAAAGGGNAMLQLLFPARSEKQNEQEATHAA